MTGSPVNVVDCLGDLASPLDPGDGNAVTITIRVFITAESGPLDYVACVDVGNTITESDELNNCSDHGSFVAPPTPTSPDLLVTKSASDASTTPGADLTYTITISNVGTAKAQGWNGATGLTLTDTLSPELTFTNVSTTNGWLCTVVTGTVTCHDNGTGMRSASARTNVLRLIADSCVTCRPRRLHRSRPVRRSSRRRDIARRPSPGTSARSAVRWRGVSGACASAPAGCPSRR
jgi:uncharacterized repeat protein (TIGR01451 family)